MNILFLLILLGQSGYAGSPPDCIYEALELVRPNASDIVFDIGSGDGRVVTIASKLYKCKSVGIEFDKNLATLSKQTVKKNGVSHLVEIRNEDALKSDLSKATIIYLYHQSNFLNSLKPQLDKLKDSITIICLDYPLPWRTESPQKIIKGEDGHQHSIYIYKNIKVKNDDSPLIKAAKLYPGVRFYEGQRHPLLVELAETYSKEMAAINSQSKNRTRWYIGEGHFGVEKRYEKIRQELGMKGDEVTAESWSWKTNYPMEIIAKEMFDSWKYSSGHWAVISRPHKLYGDGIALSKQGIWYATVLVAD